ncbi:unnamed protein product [Litomosoides sigmodontis]|uniref:Uncharacterized protein n=1 Tax=Litomosoides sigmodontis TaxID=42156 RepID=A0A3P6UC52_LITSI|nr:unnamed protein product [Litomosoides sigmodontis]
MGHMRQQRVQHMLETITDPVKLRKKLLPLVEECGKLLVKDNFGWALLAKLVYACDQEMLRSISSRIQKKLIAATKEPVTVPLLHFVRSFLVRFQWLKNFNEQTLACICSRSVDFSVRSCSHDTTRLVSNIYALWAGTKYDYILIKALKTILSDAIVEEKNENEKALFRFETVVQRYLPQFISTMFTLHTEVMMQCSSDDKIAINEWLDIAYQSAVVIEAEKKAIFQWLKTFLLKAKSFSHIVVRRISSFINDFYHPSEAYYEAVKEYVQLGPDLSVNTLFRNLIRSARCHLNSQEYGKAYAAALGSMLELRPYLLDVQYVIELQHLVCQEAFQNRKCRPALFLLNSLLAMNNELVPSPIQIAQSIFCQSEVWCDEVRLGRALCSSISRPRIQIFVPQEALLKKLCDTARINRLMDFDDSQNSAKPAMPEKSECNSASVENYESVAVESVENVRKRVHSPAGKRALKYVRIDSECDEEMLSAKSESSNFSEILEIKDEQEIPAKAECTLMEQKELRETAVVNATAVKLNSNSETVVLDKDVVGCELTIQQMMADFVPELKCHP